MLGCELAIVYVKLFTRSHAARMCSANRSLFRCYCTFNASCLMGGCSMLLHAIQFPDMIAVADHAAALVAWPSSKQQRHSATQ